MPSTIPPIGIAPKAVSVTWSIVTTPLLGLAGFAGVGGGAALKTCSIAFAGAAPACEYGRLIGPRGLAIFRSDGEVAVGGMNDAASLAINGILTVAALGKRSSMTVRDW